MNIELQLELFYRRIRQTDGNSAIESAEALARINDARRSEAIKTRFYRVDDRIVATGGETYWTMKDDFTPIEARDWATCNGRQIIEKYPGEWPSLTNSQLPGRPLGLEVWGMLDKNTFYRYPEAVAGDVMVWKGSAVPPELLVETGADVSLTDREAELTVLAAAIRALEDLNGEPGPVLVNEYKEVLAEVKKRSKVRGPRLEAAPGY